MGTVNNMQVLILFLIEMKAWRLFDTGLENDGEKRSLFGDC